MFYLFNGDINFFLRIWVLFFVFRAQAFEVRTIVQFPWAVGEPLAVDIAPHGRVTTQPFVMKHSIGTRRNFEMLKTFVRTHDFCAAPVGKIWICRGAENRHAVKSAQRDEVCIAAVAHARKLWHHFGPKGPRGEGTKRHGSGGATKKGSLEGNDGGFNHLPKVGNIIVLPRFALRF